MSTLVIFLSNLAGYLPYGLKFRYDNDIPEKLISIDTELIAINFGWGNALLEKDFKNVKPILTPLSKFTSINSPEMKKLELGVFKSRDLCDYANGQTGIDSISFGLAQTCFQNHIDLFNLIPKGLAVEKS